MHWKFAFLRNGAGATGLQLEKGHYFDLSLIRGAETNFKAITDFNNITKTIQLSET